MKNLKKKELKSRNGITLIALVITIIVLLILAGISISMLSGNNSILSRAAQAEERTEKIQIIENAQIEIIGQQTDNKSSSITKEQLATILNKYFKPTESTEIPDEISSEHDVPLTTLDDKYIINLSEIYSGSFMQKQNPIQFISKQVPYVGYYADIEADGIIDGIIYADLAVGNTKNGNWGGVTYTIPQASNLKDYYVSKTAYEGVFGTKDVLSPNGTGNERFYIMDLSDYGTDNYCWYYKAGLSGGTITNYASITSADFGKGYSNTNTMITKWNKQEYGAQNGDPDFLDLWGLIQSRAAAGWFVPSKDEWAAFGGELEITTNNYVSYGLSREYWSSTLSGKNTAWYTKQMAAITNYQTISVCWKLRLSTIF